MKSYKNLSKFLLYKLYIYIHIHIYEISHAATPILKLVAARVWQNWCLSLRLHCFAHRMDGVLRHTVFSTRTLLCPAYGLAEFLGGYLMIYCATRRVAQACNMAGVVARRKKSGRKR